MIIIKGTSFTRQNKPDENVLRPHTTHVSGGHTVITPTTSLSGTASFLDTVPGSRSPPRYHLINTGVCYLRIVGKKHVYDIQYQLCK